MRHLRTLPNAKLHSTEDSELWQESRTDKVSSLSGYCPIIYTQYRNRVTQGTFASSSGSHGQALSRLRTRQGSLKSAPSTQLGSKQCWWDSGEVTVFNSLGIKAASRGGKKASSAPDPL